MKKICVSVFLIGLSLCGFSVYAANQQATTQDPVCGNGVRETGEQCDGADLGGDTCITRGYAGGTLSCDGFCDFVVTSCTSGGGGSGGSGGGSYIPPVTGAIFNGRAYPKSTVTLLKDAQVAATTTADANAGFSINLTGLTGGNYIFSLYSEDSKGRQSSLHTFPVSVTSGVTSTISGIFIAPTIGVDKSEVKLGDNIAIFGQSAPNSEITVSVNSEEEFFNKTNADPNGVYLYNFDSTLLTMGQHLARSRSSLNNEVSPYGKSVGFWVGDKSISEVPAICPNKGDLNGDCAVDLVDFSIAAYWYKRVLGAKFGEIETGQLNSDGKISLVDFSIMAYYWTG